MKAKLLSISSPDATDLALFIPDNPKDFCVLFQVFIGIDGQEGEESFEIEVCTPQWLISNYQERDVIFICHTIIVFKYDFDSIFEKLKGKIESCLGNTWDEIVRKLRLVGRWEFEEYN